MFKLFNKKKAKASNFDMILQKEIEMIYDIVKDQTNRISELENTLTALKESCSQDKEGL